MCTPVLNTILVAVLLVISSCSQNQPEASDSAEQVASQVVLQELDGYVEVEAENFHRKSANNAPREWYLISTDSLRAHAVTDQAASASSETYMEGLPDTRVTHDDSLIVGTNFFPEPGVGPILEYDVSFNTPGRYIVWARAHSTGTEDNGIHVGINGEWPEGGQRMQWCDGKGMWTWASAQRVPENHCGVPKTIYLDIPEAGTHTIQFSMREDGFEFDKWIMTMDTTTIK